MCDSIICGTYIPRLLIEYIILYVVYMGIYSPPCIIDGVVYMYYIICCVYMCMHSILYYMCVLYTKKSIAIYALLWAHIAIYRPT